MKRKTIALLALGIVAALIVSPIIVQAAGNSQKQLSNIKPIAVNPVAALSKEAPPGRIRQQTNAFCTQLGNGELKNWENKEKPWLTPFADDEELPDLDEAEVEKLLDEYKELLDAENVQVKRIWILLARGRSWKVDIEPEINEVAPEDCIPIGMRLVIRPVKAEDGTVVFRVVRGVVIHDGEKKPVTGAGALRTDGTFVLKLEGDGLELKAVGRAFKWRRSYFVVMKGRMTLEDEAYAFFMRGRAFRLRPLKARATPIPEEKTTPEIPS